MIATPAVTFQTVSPESMMYKRGAVYVKLEGFHAWLYRMMIWQYGEAKATENFWWLWHKKEGSLTESNHHERPVKPHND